MQMLTRFRARHLIDLISALGSWKRYHVSLPRKTQDMRRGEPDTSVVPNPSNLTSKEASQREVGKWCMCSWLEEVRSGGPLGSALASQSYHPAWPIWRMTANPQLPTGVQF